MITELRPDTGRAPDSAGAAGARRLAPLLTVVVASLFVYAGTLGHDFVWDDHLIIRHVDRASEVGGLPKVLAAPFLPTAGVPNNYYRPVVYATYWLDRTVGGGPGVAHLVNVLLHAGVSVLVLLFARRLLGDGLAAVAAGLFFAAHPVHVETVAWVAGRTDILCALFALGAALAWCCAVSLPPSPGRSGRFAAAGLLYALACLSKELALTLPLALLVLPTRSRGTTRDGIDRRPWWRTHLPPWLGTFAPSAAAVLLVRQVVLRDELGHVGLLAQLQGSLLVQEPLVAVGALLSMLRSQLVPWPHNALVTRAVVGFDPITVVAVAALAAAAAITLRWFRGAAIAGAVWIAAFGLPSLLVPAGGIVVAAERYAYLPSVGVAVLIGALASLSGRLRTVTPDMRSTGIAVVILSLAGASFLRAPVWADDDVLTADIVRTSPSSSLSHQMRGDVLLAEGRVGEAVQSYTRAAALDPASAVVLRSLGLALMRGGEPGKAVAVFRASVAAEPDWRQPRIDLALACAETGDWACVRDQRAALGQYPDDLATLESALAWTRR